MSFLALSLVLSTLIPQIPQGQSADPQAWLAVEPGALNLNSGLVRTLGLSDLYHALWFRLLLALTGLALFTWTVDAADLAWRAARGRWTRAALASWGSRPLQACVSSAYPAEEVQARLGSFLARQGYRWAGVADQALPTGVAVRRLVALWAQPLALTALLVALLSLAVLANWGWQNEDWRPAVGGSQVIGHNTPYTLRLDAYTADPDGEGRLAAESTVTWLEDDKTVAQDLVREGWPATRAGLAVRQVGQVPGVTIHGTDEAGESLRLQSGSGAAYEIGLAFETAEVQHLILLPDQNLFLLLNLDPALAGDKPVVRVALLRGADAQQEPLGILDSSGVLSVGRLQIEIDLGYWPVLRVDHRPGMAWAIAWMALALAALAAGWLVPPQMFSIVVVPGEEERTLIHLRAIGGPRESDWLARLAAQLQDLPPPLEPS